MQDPEDRIEDRILAMLSETQETKYGFVLAEISGARDLARTIRARLESGDIASAEVDLRVAEKVYETVVRFLPDLSEAQRAEVDQRWKALRKDLDDLHHLHHHA